jgi:Fe/S biogenesis protein NfuA
MSAELIPVHPEPVEGEPLEMRWLVPAGTFAFVGPVGSLPDVMDALVHDGTLAAVELEPAAVRTRLATGRTWRSEGARVRTAVQNGASDPVAWRPAVAVGPDDVLRMAAQQVVDGDVGDYVRSHGGQITVLDVHDGDVEVHLSGACTHCPASDVTLTDRVESALRSLYPDVHSVTNRAVTREQGGRRLLSLTPLRPH